MVPPFNKYTISIPVTNGTSTSVQPIVINNRIALHRHLKTCFCVASQNALRSEFATRKPALYTLQLNLRTQFADRATSSHTFTFIRFRCREFRPTRRQIRTTLVLCLSFLCLFLRFSFLHCSKSFQQFRPPSLAPLRSGILPGNP